MTENSNPLPVAFAFDGALGDVLQRHFLRDMASAKLDAKFRLYYLLRPIIPQGLRQFIQRSRNQTLEIDNDWYIPSAFLAEFDRTLQLLPSGTKVIHPWPKPHRYAISLTHDIESAQGQQLVDNIAQIEERFGLRSAWYFVPYKYKVDAGLIADLKARGHEIGIHGYNHDGRLFTSKTIFDYRTHYINAAGVDFDCSGFRAPMVHRNLQWMQALDFDYDASCFDVDPFQAMPGGVGGVWPFMAGKLVELPYTLPQDHTLLVTLGQTSSQIWIRKLKLLQQLCGMAMLVTHPDYLQLPSRLDVYRDFCEHVAAQSDAWKCLPAEIARWWRLRDASRLQGTDSLQGPAAELGQLVNLKDLFSDLRVPPLPS
jgi:peptidoglycan/xylan/chitin deacetylase (PgdA/CDA1 family)